MSRRDWSTSNFLRYASGVATVAPLTIACWAKTSITATAQSIVGLYTSGSAFNRNSFILQLSTGDAVRFSTADGAGQSNASTSTTISANTWFHACGRTSSASSRDAYLNGGGKGSNATSATPTGINRTSVGVGDGSSASNQFAPAGTGDIAEVAIWSIALSDADIATLATGVSPLSVHPESLVGYWPVIGVNSPENNLLSNTSVLSVQGSLSQSAHPRILMPHRRPIRGQI